MQTLARVRKRNPGGDLPSWTASVEAGEDSNDMVGKNFQFFSDSKEVRVGVLVVLALRAEKNRFGRKYYKANLLMVKEEI